MSSSEVSRIWMNVSKHINKYRLISNPLVGQSYDFIMGTKLENVRNLINEKEDKMRDLREIAASLQNDIQHKQAEFRELSVDLRNLKMTDPKYKSIVNEQFTLSEDIENLEKELIEHQDSEQKTFDELQQSIRDYHQMDGEYRERYVG